MNKREFIKTSLAALSAASLPVALESCQSQETSSVKSEFKHWVWINPSANDLDQDLKGTYSKFLKAGIRGIFFEADSERHFRIAKSLGLEAHRWMWTMNRGEKSLLTTHPEWYAQNRMGESCADKPPYVDYYRWLCPSKPEVLQYLAEDVKSILSNDYVDGIHLDYVRYCDVILAVNLWEKYGIVQEKELPQYDYCYCETCCEKFKQQYGRDIRQVQFPDQDLSWRKFRYDQVNTIVNALSEVAKSFRKPITAAVFPTPEVARRIVRQDWTNWNLDAVFPMIYHGFYKEEIQWIGDAVAEGLHFLNARFPLYAGLYLPDFRDITEVEAGMRHALKNGASGISIFGEVTDEILSALKSASMDQR
jgi:hypothetical protein